MPREKKSEIERFIEKIRPNPDTGCWEWTAWVNSWGYGFFSGNRKSRLAHRSSYELFCGEIPDDMLVLHKCDNPRCVRPSHLFLGTVKDNSRDMVEKGRQAYGTKNGNCKTSPEVIREIKARQDLKLREISEMFGISIKQASRIRRGEQWKHIE